MGDLSESFKPGDIATASDAASDAVSKVATVSDAASDALSKAYSRCATISDAASKAMSRANTQSDATSKALSKANVALSNASDAQSAAASKLPLTAFSGLSQITVGSSAPSSPDTGDVWIDTAALYTGWGPIYQLTPPVIGDFSWVNQEEATTDTTYGGIYLLAPKEANDQMRILIKSAPSTPYVITAAILFHMHLESHNQAGLCFRQSSDGKLHSFHLGGELIYHGNICSTKWNSPTSYNAHYIGGASGVHVGASWGLLWLQIADNGTNRICSWSPNGQHWHASHTIGRTDFLTANQVGFFADSNNATWPCALHLISWKET